MSQLVIEGLLEDAYAVIASFPNVGKDYDLYYTHLASFGSAIAMGNEFMARKHFGEGKSVSNPKSVDICRKDILLMVDAMEEKHPNRDVLTRVTALRMALLYVKNNGSEKLTETKQPVKTYPQQPAVSKYCPNLSYKFYVGNFDNYKDILANNAKRVPYPFAELKKSQGFQSIELQVTYPGLATGLGLLYENDSDEGVKSGFSLDYNTGLPVIQGSNVKGRLRSIMEALAEPTVEADLLSCIQVDSLEKRLQALGVNTSGLNYRQFILDIFEDNDVFFDAFADSVDCLAADYVTKHSSDGFSNPIPVRFLRMKPGTKLTFLFRLSDSALLTAVQKKKLFIELLKDYGIGAKVNKGYGYLEEVR